MLFGADVNNNLNMFMFHVFYYQTMSFWKKNCIIKWCYDVTISWLMKSQDICFFSLLISSYVFLCSTHFILQNCKIEYRFLSEFIFDFKCLINGLLPYCRISSRIADPSFRVSMTNENKTFCKHIVEIVYLRNKFADI